MTHSLSRSFAGAALIGVALLGCARVDVRKVPVRSNYQRWGDDVQQAADSIPGVRYYLPRPYMSVDRPFTVGGGDFIVSGRVDADGSVVSINPGALPPYLAKHFSLVDGPDGMKAVLGADSIHVPTSAPRAGGDLLGQQSTAGEGAGAGAAAAAGDTADTPDKLVTATAITAAMSPNPVFSPVETFAVDVTVPKGAIGDLEAGSSPSPTPCLVPWGADSRPLLDKVVRLSISAAPTNYAADKDGVYHAQGRVADMKQGQFYVPALLFRGRMKDEPAPSNRWILLWRRDPVLTIVNAPLATGASEKKSEKETSADADAPKTSTSFTAGGNPATDPVLHVNPTVSVVMLPDFEEQYAVNVSGGLGQAKSKISLENGWLMENVETAVDNRELGKFVFKQIDKFTDIAAALLKDELLPTAAEAAGAAASGVGPQSTALERGSAVMLRIRYVVQAQPGLYPILKPGEVERWKQVHAQFCPAGSDACASEGDNAVFVPCPPYTVVAKDVYRRVVVTLLSARPRTPPADDDDPDPVDPVGDLTELKADERVAVLEWLGKLLNPLSFGGKTAAELFGGAVVAQTYAADGHTHLVLRIDRPYAERVTIRVALNRKEARKKLLKDKRAPLVDDVLVEPPAK